jgi:hypothetical protein
MKRIDIFLILLIINVFIVCYSMVTSNPELFIRSTIVAKLMFIGFIVTRKRLFN